ncbi:MAG TPA: hypothetical protein VEL28_10570 [Candidatus Binatia bacterium]|nr:hypothetical protein [Candidatus Binatia bacterium]
MALPEPSRSLRATFAAAAPAAGATRALRIVVTALGLLIPATAPADYSCTIDLLGNRYDVFVPPRVGGLSLDFESINNVTVVEDERVATSVGAVAGMGLAITYTPESGISVLHAPGPTAGASSKAQDINDEGVVLGWHRASVNHQRRAFIFTNEDGFQFLDELYPSVAAFGNEPLNDQTTVVRGTRGWAISNAGHMLLADHNSDQGSVRLLDPSGTLSALPPNRLQCVALSAHALNNDGDIVPPGVLSGGEDPYCSQVNIALNDSGSVVGSGRTGPDGEGFATRDGAPLPGGEGETAFAINNSGYVSGSHGLIWTPENELHDIGQAIFEQCDPETEAYELLDLNHRVPHAAYINDDLWITTERIYLRPARPEISYSTQGMGFQFFNDGTPQGTGFGVVVGNTFSVTVTVKNTGRNALHNFSIDATRDPTLFRRVSGPTPSPPSILLPGQTYVATSQFEAVGAGELFSTTVVAGTDAAGTPYEFVQNTVRLIFVGNGGLNATIDATPDEVAVEKPFTVTLTATNTSADPLTDVHPTGDLLFSGEGEAELVSGPVPAQIAVLAPGASADFVYEYEATKGGQTVITGSITATTEDEEEVVAEAQCSLGGDEASLEATARSVPTFPTCPLTGGAIVEIAACTVDLVLHHANVDYAKPTGDAYPPPDTGYPPGQT